MQTSRSDARLLLILLFIPKHLSIMKKFLSMAVAALFMCALNLHAQTSLLATLNHDGEISIFYGATALKQAHAAAAHGDVITLSSGTFGSTDITKAVTIRGAGMTVDTLSHTEPTVLANDFTINVADTLSERFVMEGIYSNQTVKINCLKNALFLKSRFNVITYSNSSSKMKDLTFIHCRIADRLSAPNTTPSVSFINSVVYIINQYNESGYFSLVNCYTKTHDLANSEYKNCIIYSNRSSYGNSTSTYFYNLRISDHSAYYITTTNSTNTRIPQSAAPNLATAYRDDLTYELTAELKLLKSTDGTEIGIHGGSLPYDATPTNPQITKFNVAAKSTADGKLSVDIEVNSAE